jgi:hypothetical protein
MRTCEEKKNRKIQVRQELCGNVLKECETCVSPKSVAAKDDLCNSSFLTTLTVEISFLIVLHMIKCCC